MGWQALLGDRADVYRPTESGSASGSTTLVYPDTATSAGLRCSIQQSRGRVAYRDDGTVVQSSHVGYFLPDADVREKDRVLALGTWYDVRFSNAVRYRGTGHHRRVALDRVAA